MRNFIFILGVFLGCMLFSCTHKGNERSYIDAEAFNSRLDDKDVSLYVLRNTNGITIQVTNYGARVVSLLVPDRDGVFEDIVLGYNSLDAYLSSNEIYYGAAIGRVGNRIANGRFSLRGIKYQLARNNGDNHLHGGINGFNNRVWDVGMVNNNMIEFYYLSKDMEEGYPGNLEVKMVYELTDNNEFKITYEATTDVTTLCNLTHHSFFNLKGAGNGTINDHILYINADYYTPVDETLIPTGLIESVENTPFDFRTPVVIGKGLKVGDNAQLGFGNGYDHNFVLNKYDKQSVILAASVYEPKNGRFMEVYTDQPGLQFYGGNFLNSSDFGKRNKPYEFRSAFCLETQGFPDAPNNGDFPSIILRPGEIYTHTCIYSFSVK
jgi:aldose 1-epimerase